MITDARFQKLPAWIKRTMLFLSKIKVPSKLVVIVISVLATIWFLVRVIPKPSRATYPCMQVVAPLMSGFVIWLISLSGAVFAFSSQNAQDWQDFVPAQCPERKLAGIVE